MGNHGKISVFNKIKKKMKVNYAAIPSPTTTNFFINELHFDPQIENTVFFSTSEASHALGHALSLAVSLPQHLYENLCFACCHFQLHVFWA